MRHDRFEGGAAPEAEGGFEDLGGVEGAHDLLKGDHGVGAGRVAREARAVPEDAAEVLSPRRRRTVGARVRLAAVVGEASTAAQRG